MHHTVHHRVHHTGAARCIKARSLFLVPDLYGRIDKKDGWIVTDSPKEGSAGDPMELNLEEQMHWNVVKAEMLCPKL